MAAPDKDTQITKDFTYNSFINKVTGTGASNPNTNPAPHDQASYDNIKRFAEACVQEIKNRYGFTVTCAYRAPKFNASLGSSQNSGHAKAAAADLSFNGKLEPAMEAFTFIYQNLPFTQMLLEQQNTWWLHIHFDGRNERRMGYKLKGGKVVSGLTYENVYRTVMKQDPPAVKPGEISTSTETGEGSTGSSGTSGSGSSASYTPNRGFVDPSNAFPRIFRNNESDWHPLTGRNRETLDRMPGQSSVTPVQQDDFSKTWVQSKNENRVGVAAEVVSATNQKWQESISDKVTEYGQSYVLATPGGVSLEMDSTEGSQAFRVAHPSNSYMEIDGGGNFTQKTFANRTDAIAVDHKTYINENRFTQIVLNDDLWIGGATTIERGGFKKETINAGFELIVKDTWKKGIMGNDEYIVGGEQKMIIDKKQTVGIGLDQEIRVGGAQRTTVYGIHMLDAMVESSVTIGGYSSWTVLGISTHTAVAAYSLDSAVINISAKGLLRLKGSIIMLN